MKHSKSNRQDTEKPHYTGWPREHYNADKTEKKAYKSFNEARRTAHRLYRNDGELLIAYRCPYCGQFHIGHGEALPHEEQIQMLKRKINLQSQLLNTLKGEVNSLGAHLMTLTAKIEDTQLTILQHCQELKQLQTT